MSSSPKPSKDELLRRIRLTPSGMPRYLQIKNQVLALIAEGVLGPGDQLPTMREMAEAVAIDITTVKRCYDDLAATGAVEIRRPSGTFVTARPLPRPARAGDDLDARTLALAGQALGEAAAQGIAADALIDCMRTLARNSHSGVRK